MKKNPYTMTFGKEPGQYISRPMQTAEIRSAFQADTPPYQICMLTGVRGSGKTVMLSELSREFRESEGWIVADLNPERDLLQNLAAQLYANPEIYTMAQKAKINLSALGLGVSFEKQPPVTDVETALDLLLTQAVKKKRRILVTIDEVTHNRHVREFVSAFQILLRHDHPVFLLMTGLYDNLYNLQNDKALTFLYRAPKIELEPLNYGAVVQHYMKSSGTDRETASAMARLTKGYPFAFQVLGYLTWGLGSHFTLEEVMPEFDRYLSEFVYQKIWSELSDLDRQIVNELAKKEETGIQDLRNALGLSSGKMSVYRDRLKKKGLVYTEHYGKLSLTLPRFDAFVRLYEEGYGV